MTDFDPGRPTGDEFIDYYAPYVDLVPEGNIITILAEQIQESVPVLTSLTASGVAWQPGTGEWSANETIGHLADTERVFMHRALKIARADPVPWESVEFDPYVLAGHFERRSLADLVGEFVAVRAATVALLRGLDECAWNQRLGDERTIRSVRAIAFLLAGHELQHRNELREGNEIPGGRS